MLKWQHQAPSPVPLRQGPQGHPKWCYQPRVSHRSIGRRGCRRHKGSGARPVRSREPLPQWPVRRVLRPCSKRFSRRWGQLRFPHCLGSPLPGPWLGQCWTPIVQWRWPVRPYPRRRKHPSNRRFSSRRPCSPMCASNRRSLPLALSVGRWPRSSLQLRCRWHNLRNCFLHPQCRWRPLPLLLRRGSPLPPSSGWGGCRPRK